MNIGGFVKNSFVDYPGNIAAVIFTVGCNMKCWYCHNKHLLGYSNKEAETEIFEFLEKHKNFLDGVVISGGEPTLQPDLKDFIIKIRELGYMIKLDTNGTNYGVLKDLIDNKLIDYVAMDIKAPLDSYEKITKTKDDMISIKASIDLLLSGVVDYEFRTTYSPDLTNEDMEELCKSIKGAKRYAIQKYRVPDEEQVIMLPRKSSDHEEAKLIAEKYIENVILRGM